MPSTRSIPSANTELMNVSALVLFLELACIRWFPAHVLYLTFFTNAVLLACFVGMSVGCLLASRPVRLITRTPMLLAIALGAGMLAQGMRRYIERYVQAGGDQSNPEVVFYGAESFVGQELQFAVPAEVLFAIYFVLIAAAMIGPGQEMGRAFNRVPNRLTAYTMNLLGSLQGILVFTAFSAFQLSPLIWFATIAISLAMILRRSGEPVSWMAYGFLLVVLAITIRTAGVLPASTTGDIEQTWSPYYRIDYSPKEGFINTNQLGHQLIQPTSGPAAEPYALPYLFQRDVKTNEGTPAWPPFKRVLIIGAGSGNDVARACQWLPPDATIDAVDIDPVIQKIGMRDHPDRPYQDGRVKPFLNDGRNFLRRAPDQEYDLIVFALIDSLVLQSGYSNLRLESYLYTDECFRDVRRVLKPTGLFAMYNFFRQGWITARLRDGLKKNFGAEPCLLTNPPRDHVSANQRDAGFTMFFSGAEDVVGALRQSFQRSGNNYWYPWATAVTKDQPIRFTPVTDPPPPLTNAGPGMATELGGAIVAPKWVSFRLSTVDEVPDLRPATDDWPFLYARRAAIPSHNITGIVLMIVLSLAIWWVTSLLAGPATPGEHNVMELGLPLRSFFLGAGFMLIETKAVVQMALLFGGTWIVNTVVFAAVLLMSLCGNLLAAKLKPKSLTPYYVLLFVTLAINLAVPTEAFLGMNSVVQILLSCLLAFAPVAVAGIIFAVSFSRTRNPDRMFGANVAGALFGGLAENASMLLGFRWLGLVAVGFYLASALVGNRKVS